MNNAWDEDEDEDLEMGGWAVVHVGGDLIQDGFESEDAAWMWLIVNADMLEEPSDHYEVTEVEDDHDDEDEEWGDDEDEEEEEEESGEWDEWR